MSKCREYLDQYAPPAIAAEDRDHLDSDFSEAEIQGILGELKVGKSPGPDGFTSRFYKKFAGHLSSPMQQAFNEVSDTRGFPAQALRAHITVIPKEGKDKLHCQNFRPISLINIDLKVYSKAIALRLQPLLPAIIHREQSGFILGREARDNTIKTVSLIGRARSQGLPLCLLSVDAEKAFDRVHWGFLGATLQAIGLGARAMHRIQALYSQPTAQVRINGSLSQPFNINNGTRQGCPLSPLLYALVMEPLANAIRANPSIRGMTVGPQTHKMAIFADDLLLYVSSPHVGLPNILAEIGKYSDLSNFKINLHKSEILNVNLPVEVVNVLQHSFTFKWQQAAVKYLGVHISADPDDLYRINFLPKLAQIERDFEKWKTLSLSWFGRINAVKMDVLPRLLYVFQALPMLLPGSFLRSLQAAIGRFTWGSTAPRIRRGTLLQHRTRGGAGLPDVAGYHDAVMLSTLVGASHHSGTKLWAELEDANNRYPLSSLMWLSPKDRRSHGPLSPLYVSLLQKWDSLMSADGLSSYPSPLMPLSKNPLFPALGSRLTGLGVEPTAVTQLRHIVKDGKLLPMSVIFSGGSQVRDAWYVHGQLQSLIQAVLEGRGLRTVLSEFERLWSGQSLPGHLVSWSYGMLQRGRSSGLALAYTAGWEGELGSALDGKQWSQAFHNAHKSSLSGRIQETNYKILARWYRTPSHLHRLFPEVSDQCWRCCADTGTMIHIWWGCAPLRARWEEIIMLYNRISGGSVLNCPEVALLSISNISLSSFKRGLLRHFLHAMRVLIPRMWKSSQVPSRAQWVSSLHDTMRMEEMVASDYNRYSSYYGVWASWISFRESPGLHDWVENGRV